jgi:PAS domain S-box-containing protein
MHIGMKFLINSIENNNARIFIKDESSRFLILNRRQCLQYQKKVDEMIGMNDFDLFPYESANNFYTSEQELITNKEPIKHKQFMMDSKKKLWYIYSVKVPFYFIDTNTYGILGYSIDITNVKDDEEMLIQMENDLFDMEAELNDVFVKNVGLTEYIRGYTYHKTIKNQEKMGDAGFVY